RLRRARPLAVPAVGLLDRPAPRVHRGPAAARRLTASTSVRPVPSASRPRAGLAAPLPLFLLFGLFLAAIVYLVAASLTRRSAPVFQPSPRTRTRSANWERLGDTLTIDATDGDRWQYVSLSRGRVLHRPYTAGL